MEAVKPLTYLRQNLTLPGENFVSQWGKLTDTDKAQLREYAIQEMQVLGIPVAQ